MRKAEAVALAIVVALGAPLLFVFARAAADGAIRDRDVPLRILLGDETFERLARGEKTPLHYMGSNRRAPDFTLEDSRGRPWRLSERRGRVVVLNFWSITCAPCVEEMPSLVELANVAKQWDDVDVVAVSIDKGWDDVKQLFPARSNLTVLFDPDKRVVRDKFGTRLYPETWIIDRDGIIRLRFDGRQDWSSALVVDIIDRYR